MSRTKTMTSICHRALPAIWRVYPPSSPRLGWLMVFLGVNLGPFICPLTSVSPYIPYIRKYTWKNTKHDQYWLAWKRRCQLEGFINRRVTFPSKEKGQKYYFPPAVVESPSPLKLIANGAYSSQGQAIHVSVSAFFADSVSEYVCFVEWPVPIPIR